MHPEIHDINLRVSNNCNSCCCCFSPAHCFKQHTPVTHQHALTIFKRHKDYTFKEDDPTPITDRDIVEHEKGLEIASDKARKMSDTANKTKSRRCEII